MQVLFQFHVARRIDLRGKLRSVWHHSWQSPHHIACWLGLLVPTAVILKSECIWIPGGTFCKNAELWLCLRNSVSVVLGGDWEFALGSRCCWYSWSRDHTLRTTVLREMTSAYFKPLIFTLCFYCKLSLESTPVFCSFQQYYTHSLIPSVAHFLW